MANLLQCSVCARHVRTSEMSCPFCASTISDGSRKLAADRAAIDQAAKGASRSKRYALRAALLAGAASLAGGCGSATSNANNGGDGKGEVLVQQGGGGSDADAQAREEERRARELEDQRARDRSRGNDGDIQPMPYGCVWPDDDAVEV